MRFEKDANYLELADAISTDTPNQSWFIETNLDFKDLPIEFRNQIPRNDKQGYERLKNAVLNWAGRNGYILKS
jgi:hypothetical protein